MHSTGVIAYAPADEGALLCPQCAGPAAWDNDAAWAAVAGTGQPPLEAVDEHGRRFYDPVFAGTEVDSIPVCDQCGYPIDGYSLTAEGRRELALAQMGPELRRLLESRPFGLDAFPSLTWPGFSPLIYVTKDNGVLCADCVNKWLEEPDQYDAEQMAPWVYDIYYEGPPVQCDHCYAEIESAYGDPDAGHDAIDAYGPGDAYEQEDA